MTKTQLRAYRDLVLERDSVVNMITSLELTLYGPRAPQLSGMPRGGSGPSTPTEDAAVKIADLKTLYFQKVDELSKAIIDIECAIECLDPRERTLIRLYYLEGLTWEQVCVAMSYEWAQTHRIHAKALERLKDI